MYVCKVKHNNTLIMDVGEQIYNIVEKHCGNEKSIALKGITWASLKNLKDGNANPTLSTIRKIFEANGIPAELVLTVNVDGKKEKTKIKL